MSDEGWATPFLTKYYNIIMLAGSIDDTMKLMEMDIIIKSDKMIRGNLINQKRKLWFLEEGVELLKNMSSICPKEIVEQLSHIDERIRTLLKIYSENTMLTTTAATALIAHKDLQASIRQLYEETLKKCISG
jgi:hypothetical protein